MEDGYEIRTVQGLLGHKDVQTTMLHTHVLNRGGQGFCCTLDGLRKPVSGETLGSCGLGGQHKAAEELVGWKRKSLECKQLPPRSTLGGFVIGRPPRGLCRSAMSWALLLQEMPWARRLRSNRSVR